MGRKHWEEILDGQWTPRHCTVEIKYESAYKAWGCESCLTCLPLLTGPFWVLLGLSVSFWIRLGPSTTYWAVFASKTYHQSQIQSRIIFLSTFPIYQFTMFLVYKDVRASTLNSELYWECLSAASLNGAEIQHVDGDTERAIHNRSVGNEVTRWCTTSCRLLVVTKPRRGQLIRAEMRCWRGRGGHWVFTEEEAGPGAGRGGSREAQSPPSVICYNDLTTLTATTPLQVSLYTCFSTQLLLRFFHFQCSPVLFSLYRAGLNRAASTKHYTTCYTWKAR